MKYSKLFSEKFLILPFLLILFSFNLNYPNVSQKEELEKLFVNVKAYQDIVINGEIVKKGWGQNCDLRYQIIKKVIDKYKRPITVLDIGAAEGYFSFKIAKEYDSTCVIVQDPTWLDNIILKLCQLNNFPNVILLNKKINIEELIRLGECEHFDVVLAFNVIHHFYDNWQEAADAILKLGETVIIETPPYDPSQWYKHIAKPIEDYCFKNGVKLDEVPRWSSTSSTVSKSKLFLIERKKSEITRNNWLSGKVNNIWTVQSDNNSKKLIKKIFGKSIISNWQQGINFTTFKILSGSYPLPETLKQSLKKINSEQVYDLNPTNLVIQGKNLVPIDLNDIRFNEYYRYNIDEVITKINNLIDIKDPEVFKKDLNLFYSTVNASVTKNSVKDENNIQAIFNKYKLTNSFSVEKVLNIELPEYVKAFIEYDKLITELKSEKWSLKNLVNIKPQEKRTQLKKIAEIYENLILQLNRDSENIKRFKDIIKFNKENQEKSAYEFFIWVNDQASKITFDQVIQIPLIKILWNTVNELKSKINENKISDFTTNWDISGKDFPLIMKNLDVEISTGKKIYHGRSLLLFAIYLNDIKSIECLINYGASINSENNPLKFAIYWIRPESVKTLLNFGAKLTEACKKEVNLLLKLNHFPYLKLMLGNKFNRDELKLKLSTINILLTKFKSI